MSDIADGYCFPQNDHKHLENMSELKSAEDWSAGGFNTMADFVRAVQLDAFKAGMTRAASITSRYLENNRLHPDIPNEQLNELARVASHSVLQQAALEIFSDRDTIRPNSTT